MGKPRRRHRPRRGHAGGPGNSMFGVETNTSSPPEETANVGIIRASPPRLRQTARYSGPPRGGAHVARPTARSGLAMVIPTGRPETALDEEDASNSNSAVVAIANYTPYRETAMMATVFCSFLYMPMWDPSDLMRSGVQAFTTGPWFETRNAHLQTITTLPALCTALTKVHVSNARLLNDWGIKDLVNSCPNLKVLSFIGATRLTHASFSEIVKNLQELEMLSITGRTGVIYPHTLCKSGGLRNRESLCVLEYSPLAPKLRSLVLTGHDALSFSVGRKVSAKRAGLEIVLGSMGPLYCTFWNGELVSVEKNPGYEHIKKQAESTEDDPAEGWDSNRGVITSEDHSYDTFLSADFVEGAYLDRKTGILTPANGLYWGGG